MLNYHGKTAANQKQLKIGNKNPSLSIFLTNYEACFM